MGRSVTIAETMRLLRRRTEYSEQGWTERQIVAAESDGRLVRVRRSWVFDAAVWHDLWPAGRHLAAVLAAAGDMVGGAAVFSHESAAVLWGLPLFHSPRDVVHLTALDGVHARSDAATRRHTDHLDDSDIDVVAGIRCTSLERTVFDLMRLAGLESAVSAADAALGRVAVHKRVHREADAAAWRERMIERAARSTGKRGVKQARWVTGFADGRAELPAESASRVHLHRLGFARPEVQVPVPGPDGATYWIDLGLSDVGAWLEIDGDSKYLDESLRSGRSLEEVLLDEKRREDWVRGTTDRRFIRARGRDIRTLSDFERHLASFGLRPRR